MVVLIGEYEAENWSAPEIITDEQERKFIANRKEKIKNKLKNFDMTQQYLGILLGHKKSYMPELISGFSPFSLKIW